MVPRFAKPGRSFKAVAMYLMHDAEHAVSDERVDWTHTLNLAHDDIASAVDEMLSTFQNANILKAEQGARIGAGTEKPVKHLSLNWHPSEKPDQEAMIAAAQSFLKHMGWEEHQCALIAHNDKPHRHVHLVINTIHPETGRKLDDGFEHRRAQLWALGYEKEHGKIFCAEREKPIEERVQSIPRPAWTQIKESAEKAAGAETGKASFDSSYMAREDNKKVYERNEWEVLKGLQKEERLSFFAEGKGAYNDLNRGIYQEVRQECRADWASYYAAKKDGLEFSMLAEIRQGLIDRQNAMMKERFDAASTELRAQRDDIYRHLLDAQKAERTEMMARQQKGMRSPDLFDRVYPSAANQNHGSEKSANEKDTGVAIDPLARFGVRRGRGAAHGSEARAEHQSHRRAQSEMSPRVAPTGASTFAPQSPKRTSSRDPASGIAGGLLTLVGSLAESFTGGHSKPPPTPARDPLDRFDIRRGRSAPDSGRDKAEKEQVERDEWHEWKRKRDLDQSRSGSKG